MDDEDEVDSPVEELLIWAPWIAEIDFHIGSYYTNILFDRRGAEATQFVLEPRFGLRFLREGEEVVIESDDLRPKVPGKYTILEAARLLLCEELRDFAGECVEDILFSLEAIADPVSDDPEEIWEYGVALADAYEEFVQTLWLEFPDRLLGPVGAQLFRLCLDQRVPEVIRGIAFIGKGLSEKARFELDESKFCVTASEREPCMLGNSRPFHLLQILMSRPNQFVDHLTILDQLGASDLDQGLKVAKHRLVAALRKAGYHDLADKIHSDRGHYGYFPGPIERTSKANPPKLRDDETEM